MVLLLVAARLTHISHGQSSREHTEKCQDSLSMAGPEYPHSGAHWGVLHVDFLLLVVVLHYIPSSLNDRGVRLAARLFVPPAVMVPSVLKDAQLVTLCGVSAQVPISPQTALETMQQPSR